MSYKYFGSLFIVLILVVNNVRVTHNTLLSRMKNQNEYIASEPEKMILPEELDDDMYEDLLSEVPELRGHLRRGENFTANEYPMLPYILKQAMIQKASYNEVTLNDEDFDTEKDGDQEDYPGQLNYITITAPSIDTSHSNSVSKAALRQDHFIHNISWWKKNRKKVATCYWCGMNHSHIPYSTLCHDAFETPDWRARTMARYFRAKCYNSIWTWEHIEDFRFDKWRYYRWDRGLVRSKYGQYIGGCFKRFLDVGKIYTQRGCRSWWPTYSASPSFVDHRFTRLEAIIRGKENYCIVSPHASLTPFSRAISLYVRYHVCVCSTKYCNKSSPINLNMLLLIIALIYFTV